MDKSEASARDRSRAEGCRPDGHEDPGCGDDGARFGQLAAYPAVLEARARELKPGALSSSRQPGACVVVLDTNVVLDLYFWKDAQCRRLAEDLREGLAAPVTSAACLEELADVVSRPAFGLSAEEQLTLVRAYAQRCSIVAPQVEAPVRCRDADDQKFLEAACAAHADILYTKDKLLARAARRLSGLGLIVRTPSQGEAEPA